jgi:hypothetical protein
MHDDPDMHAARIAAAVRLREDKQRWRVFVWHGNGSGGNGRHG